MVIKDRQGYYKGLAAFRLLNLNVQCFNKNKKQLIAATSMPVELNAQKDFCKIEVI